MENFKDVFRDVKNNVHQKSASRKDEITIMKGMMNDPSYCVEVYSKDGKSDYYPGREFRKVVSSAIASITKISGAEAADLVKNYEFSKGDASNMVNFSKEFINTYLQTGRNLPLGGRETSNVVLQWKDIPDRTAGIPVKSGERTTKFIPAHGGVKAICPCPDWVSGK